MTKQFASFFLSLVVGQHSKPTSCFVSPMTTLFYFVLHYHVKEKRKGPKLFFLNVIFLSAAKISPPVLWLNTTDTGIVVRVKLPRLLVQKMHSYLQYKIYLVHASGKEVHTHNNVTPFLSLL